MAGVGRRADVVGISGRCDATDASGISAAAEILLLAVPGAFGSPVRTAWREPDTDPDVLTLTGEIACLDAAFTRHRNVDLAVRCVRPGCGDERCGGCAEAGIAYQSVNGIRAELGACWGLSRGQGRRQHQRRQRRQRHWRCSKLDHRPLLFMSFDCCSGPTKEPTIATPCESVPP